jgi:hypothetical protein
MYVTSADSQVFSGLETNPQIQAPSNGLIHLRAARKQVRCGEATEAVNK